MIIRDAKPSDARALAALVMELGYGSTVIDVERRLSVLLDTAEPPLVAEDGTLRGCLCWHVMPVLHRPTPVGRITMLIVTASCRKQGIGRGLVEAVEARLRNHGCGLIEVTSNLRLLEAHRFYESLGYLQTSIRFARELVASGT